MRNKNLDESLQTAARDLVETPDYLEDLVMWVYESKGRVPKSELIGDSMCPKSVRKYLKDGGTIKELLKEAQEAAICRMSEAEECICMQNVDLQQNQPLHCTSGAFCIIVFKRPCVNSLLRKN